MWYIVLFNVQILAIHCKQIFCILCSVYTTYCINSKTTMLTCYSEHSICFCVTRGEREWVCACLCIKERHRVCCSQGLGRWTQASFGTGSPWLVLTRIAGRINATTHLSLPPAICSTTTLCQTPYKPTQQSHSAHTHTHFTCILHIPVQNNTLSGIT